MVAFLQSPGEHMLVLLGVKGMGYTLKVREREKRTHSFSRKSKMTVIFIRYGIFFSSHFVPIEFSIFVKNTLNGLAMDLSECST